MILFQRRYLLPQPLRSGYIISSIKHTTPKRMFGNKKKISTFDKDNYLEQVSELESKLEQAEITGDSVPFLHYHALGLKEDADIEDIKLQFRAISKKYSSNY